MNRKILIVLLVAVVMVFVVTLALGAGRPTGSSSDDKGPVEFLKGLRSGSFLQIGADVSAPTCSNVSSNSVTVVAMSACTIEVAGRGFFSRPTQVALESSGPLSVTVAPSEGPLLEGDLGPGECFGTSIDRHGGNVLLKAPGAAAVTVTLRSESCPAG